MSEPEPIEICAICGATSGPWALVQRGGDSYARINNLELHGPGRLCRVCVNRSSAR
jgi:hypothetical protein